MDKLVGAGVTIFLDHITVTIKNLKDTGDYDEYGENQKAEIIKFKIIYDKKTHRMTQETEVIRSVNIPGTTLYIPEAV